MTVVSRTVERPAVVVLSIDAVAPRYVTPTTMPELFALGRSGAACYQARTVSPPITMPAHLSLLRGVEPSVHGVMDNAEFELTSTVAAIPTFLEHVRRTGGGAPRDAASVLPWARMDRAIEAGATSTRVVFDDGYNPKIDSVIADRIAELLTGGPAPRRPEVIYGYLIAPDLAGHEHGWGSGPYLDALRQADAALGHIVAACGPEDSVIVTTDHGGLGTDHSVDRPENTETFMVVRSPRVAPGSVWSTASILDVAPTVADLCSLEPHPAWQGTSLLGRERSLVEVLRGLIDEMADHSYGERVTMKEHALQTAANARTAGASPSLVAAALLHDVGHLWGEAGPWGLPGHAEVAGRALQALLPPAVVEPIRLHVAAKRWLVANDPPYRDHLSEASLVTLDQQGGPFTPEESAAFLRRPFAAEAIELRRWDDGGKRVAPNGSAAPSVTLDEIVESVRSIVDPGEQAGSDEVSSVSATWARDACRCPSCRDQGNDQHLVGPADLDGWGTVAVDRSADPVVVEIRRHDGERHRCLIPASAWSNGSGDEPDGVSVIRWDRGRLVAADIRIAHGSGGWIDRTAAAVTGYGLAVVEGVATEPGTVLDVAAPLGYVRVTNFGDLFDVRTEAQPENLAYTSVGLPLHTDNPYRDPCPTVQLLHCLQPAESGGASILADGFEAAERLRAADPAAFDTLATTPVRFRFHGDAVDLQAVRTIIELEPGGEVVAVNVNHRSMEAPPPGPGIEDFYRAYELFNLLVADPDLVFELTLAAGDLIVFDNRRVLHARTAFDTSSARHLQGCYIDIDALRSRARVAAR